MKNRSKLFQIIMLAAVLICASVFMTSCGGDDDDLAYGAITISSNSDVYISITASGTTLVDSYSLPAGNTIDYWVRDKGVYDVYADSALPVTTLRKTITITDFWGQYTVTINL